MNYNMEQPTQPVYFSQEDYTQLRKLADQSGVRGLRLNTRIIYQHWKTLFGVNKAPNGCPSCMRTDLSNFASRWRELERMGMIEIENNNNSTTFDV